MKKSILATLFAGLFAIGSLSAMAGDETHAMKLKIKKEDGGQAVIDVEKNGDAHVFELSAEELKDEALLAERLSSLDDDTRDEVIRALKGIHSGDGHRVFIDKESLEDVDGDKKVVIIKDFKFEGGDSEQVHTVFINVDGEHHGDSLHKIVEAKGGKAFAFKIGDGADMIKMHHDGGHTAKVIEKLLKHAKLTPEQIDALQQALDDKRNK